MMQCLPYQIQSQTVVGQRFAGNGPNGLYCYYYYYYYYYLQKSLDAGMQSYIVQLDFSTAFDRVSHSGLLFKS